MAEVMDVAADLRRAAEFFAEALRPSQNGSKWTNTARPTDWSCRDTLDHVANALCGYAASLSLRLRTRRQHHPRNGDTSASVPDLFDAIAAFAEMLAVIAESAPTDVRAFHPAGMADRDGFIAMGCDEILVHGHDVASTLRIEYQPAADLAARVLTRLFPWVEPNANPWDMLLWANGRVALPGKARLGADWWWHCAPLDEWSGIEARRTESDRPGWK